MADGQAKDPSTGPTPPPTRTDAVSGLQDWDYSKRPTARSGAFTPLPDNFDDIVKRQEGRLDVLWRQQELDRNKRHALQRDSTIALFAGLAIAMVATVTAVAIGPDATVAVIAMLMLALFLAIAGASGLAFEWVGGEPLSWHEKNREQRRLQELRDLRLPIDARAERQLTDHRNELDEYYRQARSQSQTIFITGIGILFFSFLLVGALLVVVTFGDLPEDSKRYLSFVTLISTLVTDVIAAIYLRMFGDTQKNLAEFHMRLAGANSLYFANVVVARMADPETRSAAAAIVAAEASRYWRQRLDEVEATATPSGPATGPVPAG